MAHTEGQTEDSMTVWIYFLGERRGRDLKIGRTNNSDVLVRVKAVNTEQTTDAEYVLLAAVRGEPQHENALHNHFEYCRRTDKGKRKEYYEPDPELIGYINWLRGQWWVSPDGKDNADDLPVQDASHWLPVSNDRCWPPPPLDYSKLIQDYDFRGRDLDDTAWSWMADPKASIQDYFTPTEIIDAARAAMGHIDLDAASHWLANRAHKIPDYFTSTRSAFENEWHGNVWLNPPYGSNEVWFERIIQMRPKINALCMLSPVWAFTTEIAKPVIELSTSFVLLSPTPKFWGNLEGKTGTNNPHGVLYLGDEPDRFAKAFAPHGISLLIPDEDVA